MRSVDQYEFACVGLDHQQVALHMVNVADEAYIAYLDGEPVFVWGIGQGMVPHVRAVFGFGTDRTPRVIPALTKWGKEQWLPRAFNQMHIERLEVRVPKSCESSIKWLISLGLSPECEVNGLSITGEPHIQLALTKSDWAQQNVHFQHAGPAEASGSHHGAGEDISR